MNKPDAQQTAAAKRIMVVEDEFITAADITSNLVNLGYEVPAVAKNGAEAIAQATALRPDLILMDVVLVGPMNGIQAAAEIRQSLAIPIVFLTAHADAETIAAAKRSEPFGFLPKPCNACTMMTTIEMALHKNRADQERQRLENQLQQSRKMASVGRLAGGVAHYLNNMLSVMMGYADMAQERLAPSDPLFADLQKIISAGRRATDIIKQLLTFTRQQAISPQILDLNTLIKGRLDLLRTSMTEEITLLWQPGTPSALVEMDARQIELVLHNLLANARDAIRGQGTITVRTASVDLDIAQCKAHEGVVPGRYQMIHITDDGRGMDKETAAQIFDPFFTTKLQGEGIGLGLATVYGIIKQNQGFIEVVSFPGDGTSIKVYLPELPTRVTEPALTGNDGIMAPAFRP